jgi:hypothetical protein
MVALGARALSSGVFFNAAWGIAPMAAHCSGLQFVYTTMPQLRYAAHGTLQPKCGPSGQLPDRAGIQASIRDISPRATMS